MAKSKHRRYAGKGRPNLATTDLQRKVAQSRQTGNCPPIEAIAACIHQFDRDPPDTDPISVTFHPIETRKKADFLCPCGKQHLTYIVSGIGDDGKQIYLHQGICGTIYLFYFEREGGIVMIGGTPSDLPTMPILLHWKNAPDASCLHCRSIDAADLKPIHSLPQEEE